MNDMIYFNQYYDDEVSDKGLRIVTATAKEVKEVEKEDE
jgi:hypothetical protein